MSPYPMIGIFLWYNKDSEVIKWIFILKNMDMVIL